MKRSIGVILAAVVQFLGSAVTVLMGIGMFLAVTVVFHAKPGVPFVKGVLLAEGCVLVVLGGLGIATAVGLLLLKRWARISTLIFAWWLIVMGVFSALSMAAIPIPAPKPEAQHVFTVIKLGTAGFFLLLAAIGGWWAWMFTRPKVREQFVKPQVSATGEAGALVPAETRPQTPLSILVIGWLMLIGGAMSTPFAFFFQGPMPVLTHLYMGTTARLVEFCWAIVTLAIGLGLIRRLRVSLPAAIALYVIGGINALVFYLAPGAATRISHMVELFTAQMPRLPGTPPPPPPVMPPAWFECIIVVLSIGVPLYFLITRKKAFEEAVKS